MDGKSELWRDSADKLLVALAKQNRYIVSDILIVFLESAGFGLKDYTPLGGVFKRGAKNGTITKISNSKKKILWHSNIYKQDFTDFDENRMRELIK